jgi:hypothetical protein
MQKDFFRAESNNPASAHDFGWEWPEHGLQGA